MSRATVPDVEKILPTGTQLTDLQIQASIDAATCAVDQIASSCASHLTDACLLQVEVYLSAHYAASTENTLSLSSETDSCSGDRMSYGFKFGAGVMGTPYGQTANMLSGGCLAEMDKRPVDLIAIGSC